MSLSFHQKEDFHLRMADLEKKLAESEEERSKLEKTCNVLMRAFREEEKMHYKALNERYEKFLEDCTVRKRRNDIILRSLCRIEDRTKALFAKTERLKLLKDRYISYMTVSYVKQEKDACFEYSRRFPLSVLPQSTTNDVITRVNRATPLEPFKTVNIRELEGNLLSRIRRPTMIYRDIRDIGGHGKSQELQINQESYKTPERNVFSREESLRNTRAQGILYSLSSLDFQNTQETPILKSFSHENEKLENDELKLGNFSETQNNLSNKLERKINEESCIFSGISDTEGRLKFTKALGTGNSLPREFDTQRAPEFILKSFMREDDKLPDDEAKPESKVSEKLILSDKTELKILKGNTSPTISHDESIEKLKSVFSLEKKDENSDYIFDEKAEGQENKSHVVVRPVTSHHLVITTSNTPAKEEEKLTTDSSEENVDLEKMSNPLPKGLDGVDYQNETYPESYYEQPVHHHNHTSIASDVILEEDETEPDLDEEVKVEFSSEQPARNFLQEEKNNRPNSQSPENRVVDEPQEKFESEGNSEHVVNDKTVGTVKVQDSDSEKYAEGKQSEEKSEKSEKLGIDGNKTATKSNLSHLLESDSESFQIEHGDVISGNEDSDFDFSFHQK